jgi:hypothetical protein
VISGGIVLHIINFHWGKCRERSGKTEVRDQNLDVGTKLLEPKVNEDAINKMKISRAGE